MARERVQWIDAARGFALALVVLLHATAFLTRWNFPPSSLLVDANAILDGFRMPTLVMISGMLAATVSSWSWGEVFRRRVGPLALLYVVWAPLTVLVVHWLTTDTIGLETSTITGLLIRPEGRLWYFYALAVYIAAARLMRSVPTAPILVVAVVVNLAAVGWMRTLELPLDFQWWAYVLQHWVFFVAAERWVAAYGRVSDRRSLSLGIGSLVVFSAFGAGMIALGVLNNPVVTLMSGVLGTAVALTLFPVIGSSWPLRWARAVGRHSLGVYASHVIFVVALVALVAPVAPRFLGAGIVIPCALAAAVVATAYGLTVMLERVAPVPFLRPWWDMSERRADRGEEWVPARAE